MTLASRRLQREKPLTTIYVPRQEPEEPFIYVPRRESEFPKKTPYEIYQEQKDTFNNFPQIIPMPYPVPTQGNQGNNQGVFNIGRAVGAIAGTLGMGFGDPAFSPGLPFSRSPRQKPEPTFKDFLYRPGITENSVDLLAQAQPSIAPQQKFLLDYIGNLFTGGAGLKKQLNDVIIPNINRRNKAIYDVMKETGVGTVPPGY